MIGFRKSGYARAAILVVALMAMLGVTLASTSAEHIHLRSSGGQCDVCVTAHVVSLEAQAIFHQFGAAETYEAFVPTGAVAGYCLLLSSSSSSRGPPPFAA